VTNRTGLARQTTTGHGNGNVVLVETLGGDDRLLEF
jgi:hypothetical protein